MCLLYPLFKLIVPFYYYCEYYITHNHSAISNIYNLCGPARTVRVVRTYIHVCPQHYSGTGALSAARV
jgi:hypothetical protein